MSWTEYFWILLIATIVNGIIWGAVTYSIADKRGYYGGKWFWLGFFLAWIGVIIAATRPQNDGFAANYRASNIGSSDSEVLSRGGWKCICGRVNYAYVGTCACGRTKAGVNREKAELQKRKEEQAAVARQQLIAEKEPAKSIETSAGGQSEAGPAQTSGYAELRELKSLLDDGIITQTEFDKKKREIIGI